MWPLGRVLVGCLAAASFLTVGACGNDQSEPASNSMHDYWSTCPETPAWNRNLDVFAQMWPNEVAYATAEEAVQAVVEDSVKVEKVEEDGKAANVVVRSGDETGTFTVRRLAEGWAVERAEGCAAWPAGESLVGNHDDCPDVEDTQLSEVQITACTTVFLED